MSRSTILKNERKDLCVLCMEVDMRAYLGSKAEDVARCPLPNCTIWDHHDHAMKWDGSNFVQAGSLADSQCKRTIYLVDDDGDSLPSGGRVETEHEDPPRLLGALRLAIPHRGRGNTLLWAKGGRTMGVRMPPRTPRFSAAAEPGSRRSCPASLASLACSPPAAGLCRRQGRPSA